jgi:16S rRNA (cytosine967-C5)-methyltransferase
MVRPGGRLLYCTCSIFAAEGIAQQQAFLESNTDVQLLDAPGHLLPDGSACEAELADNVTIDHDGFFYSLFQKKAH